MSTWKRRIETIKPHVFSEDSGIRAWFTLKNRDGMDGSKHTAGLNLGSNTADSPEQITKNRRALFETLDIDPDWVAFGEQVHSNRVRLVTDGGTYPETDGMVTAVPGLALAIQVADCAAILISDPVNRIIAAVHAGWRGSAADILPRAIGVMEQHGAVPAGMKAFVSPCLSKKNFEVGEEVAEQFPDRFVDRTTYSKPHVDLKQFLADQMLQAGIPEHRIEVHGGCTVEDTDRFFSYRREKEKSGRMLGLIQIKRDRS